MTRLTLRERLAATGVELRHLADRVRTLIETTVTSEAPVEALDAAAEAVDRALAALLPHAPTGRPQRFPEPGPFTSPNDFMPFDPLIGRFSPMAPPIEMAWNDGKVLGRVDLRCGRTRARPAACTAASWRRPSIRCSTWRT